MLIGGNGGKSAYAVAPGADGTVVVAPRSASVDPAGAVPFAVVDGAAGAAADVAAEGATGAASTGAADALGSAADSCVGACWPYAVADNDHAATRNGSFGIMRALIVGFMQFLFG